MTAEILDPSGLIDKRSVGLYANEEPARLGALVKKLMPEIMPLFDDKEIIKHIWIHAIKHWGVYVIRSQTRGWNGYHR